MNRAALEIDDKGTRYDDTRLSVLPGASSFTTEYAKDRPEIRLVKWGREAGCTISYQGVKGTLAIVNGTVQWTDGNRAVHAYPLLPDADNDDGGVEIEIVLGAKPASNVFSFNIDGAAGLEFYKQPDVEIPPEFPNLRVPVHARGSYAVYHATKRNHARGKTNYGCGKAFHIYRPKAIDALGIEQWCVLDYANGVLTVTVPPRFLENAAYPVRVDPTFGHTGTGTGTGSYNLAELKGSLGTTADGDGDVDAIVARIGQSGSTLWKGVLLTADGSAIVTNGVTPATAIPATVDWATASYVSKPAVTDATNYTVCAIGNSYVMEFRQDTGPAGSGFYGTNGTYTTPVAGGSFNTVRSSIYAEYTAAGSAAVEPSVNEAVTLTEDVSMKMHLGNVNLNEAVTVDESVTVFLPRLVPTVSEDVTVSDSVTVSLTSIALSLDVNDAVTVAESVTMALSLILLSGSDTVTVNESVALRIGKGGRKRHDLTVVGAGG